jgi:hypothetical protein
MLFGKRKKKTPAEAVPTSAAEDLGGETTGDDQYVIDPDVALDFMAEMLRILGEHAFDVETKSAQDIEEFFETWARHLLVGIPPPTHAEAPEKETRDASSKRDLPRLRRFLQAHRAS